MAKFEGWGQCGVCSIWVHAGDFVDTWDNHHGRICIPCYWEDVNPSHPDIDSKRADIASRQKKWKCLKWRREDSKSPNGPLQSRK